MQVVIPADAEAFVKNQANAAGYQDVSEYLLSLVRHDHEARARLDAFASDQRIETLALEGLDSGPAVPLDMQAIRREVTARLEKSGP